MEMGQGLLEVCTDAIIECGAEVVGAAAGESGAFGMETFLSEAGAVSFSTVTKATVMASEFEFGNSK